MKTVEELITPKEAVPSDKKALVMELFELKHQIKVIEERELKGLKDRVKAIESHMFATLEVGEQLAYAGVGSVSIKEEIQPNVEDWESFYAHVTNEQAFYLMPRKVNAAPFREALGMGQTIPGVGSVTVRKISVTKRK